ncbi:zinc finger protein 595-like [Leptidea sinapis]|uniref:zinc finger protein 595-like n=1 Tax=Leptidea sinapis TaxID=189913 RepID=UPI002128D681|nr:zinc finger protein 595-like [Leptidea sinapis]
MTDPQPLVLCMENVNGDEVALKIDPHDDFRLFLDKAKFCDKIFSDVKDVMDHGEEHKHDFDDGSVFPCPLCDYGYANLKWLKGHLKAAHDKPNDAEDGAVIKKEVVAEHPPKESSPVANGTGILEKTSVNDNDEKDIKESHPNEDDTKTVQHIKFETEIKQEAIDSDDEAIWIVHTGDDVQEEQLHKLLNANTKKCPREQNFLTKHKCFNCSRIFPSAETLNTHKCRKRTRKRKPTDDNSVCVPTQEDFLKRAQGRPRSDNSLSKVKKTKSRENASQIVTCHNCNESFSSKVRLKFHMQFHDKTDLLTPEGYSCKECSLTLATETELFDHVHFQHHKQKKWQCPVEECGKMFFLRATLTKHSRTHTDTRRYVCVTCGKRFLDKQTLDEHGVTHLQIKPFQCHICLKQLTRRSRLRMHLRAHEEEVCMKLVFACGVCKRAFRNDIEAQEHTAKSTECIEEFTKMLKGEEVDQLSPTSGVVRYSNKSVTSLNVPIPREASSEDSAAMISSLTDAARSIIRVVRIEKAFRCEYCEDVFYLEHSLNSHRAKHKGIKNPFTCHICKVSFATYSRCTTHKTTHGFYKRNATEGTSGGAGSTGILGYGGFPVVKHFLCEDCGRSYLHWTYLQVHRRMKHVNENFLFKCNQCELTFPNSWSVAYHRKKVHGKTAQEDGGTTKIARQDYKIPCRDCDAVLPNKVALYKHRQDEHCDDAFDMDENEDWPESVNKDSTVCNKCGHNLHNVNALQKHLHEVHGVQSDKLHPRLKCHMCSRTFRSASARDEHMRVHTGERPYPCDVCGASFTRSTAMRNHRLVHLAVRAWSCSRCSRRFRMRSDLRTHMRLKHPAYLAVIEIEGLNPSLEQIYQKLAVHNISQQKVIEINMISFEKGSTSIVPDSRLALSMLNNVPRTPIIRSKSESHDMFQASCSRDMDKAAYTPATLQRAEQMSTDPNRTYPIISTDAIQPINVQVLLEDNALVSNQLLQYRNDIVLQ